MGRGIMNDGLIVTGATSPVAVGTGFASLHGMVYWNSESLSVDISTPTVMPRIDRIVLRIDWERHTIRIAHILGDEGAGHPPMIVDDKILDEALACCFIELDGVITIENKPSSKIEILSRDYSLSIDELPLDNPPHDVV